MPSSRFELAMRLDIETRELAMKIVYWGPAGSGKTSNLRALAGLLRGNHRASFLAPGGREEGSRFFDLLALRLSTAAPLGLRLRVWAVPGNPVYEPTRRILLRGADGVLFVADGRQSEADASNACWAELSAALGGPGLPPRDMPIVIQLNKADCWAEKAGQWSGVGIRDDRTVIPAVATRGEGVAEALLALMRAVVGKAMAAERPDPVLAFSGGVMLTDLQEAFAAQAHRRVRDERPRAP